MMEAGWVVEGLKVDRLLDEGALGRLLLSMPLVLGVDVGDIDAAKLLLGLLIDR
jgi:hypothetical protein